MVYIPRRKQKQRLDSRVGQVVPGSDFSKSAYTYGALSKVLDTMANKMAPAIMSYYAEEAKTERESRLKANENKLLDFKIRLGANPSKEDIAGMDAINQEVQKDTDLMEHYKNDWDSSFKTFKLQLHKEYINRNKKNLDEKRYSNAQTDFKKAVDATSYTGEESGARLNGAQETFFDSIKNQATSDFKLKNGRDPSAKESEELWKDPEIEFKLKRAEGFVKKSFIERSIKNIKNQSLNGDLPAATLIKGINIFKNAKNENDLEKLPPGMGYLKHLYTVGVNQGDVAREARVSIQATDNFLSKAEKKRREDNNFKVMDSISKEINDHSNLKLDSDSGSARWGKHVEKIKGLVDGLGENEKRILKEDPRYKGYFSSDPVGAETNRRAKAQPGKDFIDELYGVLASIEDGTFVPSEIEYNKPKSVYDALKGLNISHGNVSKIGSFLSKFNQQELGRYSNHVRGMILRLNNAFDHLDRFDNPHQGVDVPLSTDKKAHREIQFGGLKRGSKGEVSHSKLLSKYQRIKKDAYNEFHALILRTKAGEFSLNEAADNYIGKAVQKVYEETVQSSMRHVLQENYSTMISGKIRLFTEPDSAFKNAFAKIKEGDFTDTDERNDAIDTAIVTFNSWKKALESRKKDGQLSKGLLREMRQFEMGLHLYRDLPVDISLAQKQISGVTSGKETRKGIAQNARKK